MSDRAALTLVVAGPVLAGLALALLVQLVPRARQSLTERLTVFVAMVLAVALDFRTEGPEHGVLAYVLLMLPGVLSFAAARFVLARHVAKTVRHT
jgi:hypothetical protein